MPKNQPKKHIEKIVSKMNYVLETPSYRAIIDDDIDGYDDPNEYLNPLDNNSPMLGEADPIPGEDEEETPVGDLEMAAMGEEPPADPNAEPAPEAGVEEPIPDAEMQPAPPEAPAPEAPNPDKIQNEIIKQNIDIMKQLNNKIQNLEMGIDTLTAQNAEMHKEVEEVREPTNVEKLMTRKQDSHPYYFGLNDMWEGNWFQARRDETGERGMKQLEDGTYIADFDELPDYNDQEIKDSFDK